MKKWDLIIIIGALAVAGGLYFSGLLRADTPGGVAVVYVDGKEEVQLSLLKNQKYTVETKQGFNVVEIINGKAIVSDADCRDKVCVKHLPVSLVKESITCLPHKMIVEIKATEESEIDAVAN